MKNVTKNVQRKFSTYLGLRLIILIQKAKITVYTQYKYGTYAH